uniref:Photosystem I reaction center subunit VIII n=1 Tax=Epimedium rhizomatosum TaxID=253606 RepID=A0A7L8Y384_9MAGN|nr:photosystem I reaction center subunit VIII [Epimedium rhizomatosum]QOI13689.1 photosystem I reaction center subunit VIII [Epimedium rhizomatosum]
MQSRYLVYGNFQLPCFFCTYRGPSISCNCNGFFIYSCSKKQDYLAPTGVKYENDFV